MDTSISRSGVSKYGPRRTHRGGSSQKADGPGLRGGRGVAAYSGSSSGGQVLAPTGLARPGMCGFGFDYKKSDHHVKMIGTGHILQATDGGTILFSDNACINFGDHNADDDYSWELFNRELPEGTIFCEYVPCNGGTGISTPPHCVPVLTGFSFRFANGDHHLARMNIAFSKEGEDWRIKVGFHDQNGDDPFDGCVVVGFVPEQYVRAVRTESGSSWGGSASLPLTLNKPVLQGFELMFQNGDHHIDQIAVNVFPTGIDVRYNDKNDDDGFDWTVRIVDLV
jgi:hypothetical protein